MPKQESKKIFREQALEQLSSPEQLDQLLKVVSRRSWIPLLTLAGGLILAVIWSIAGRIPLTVEGAGVLIHPNQVMSFQSPATGQIVELTIHVGKNVQKGQTLGRINQPELAQRLEQERVRLKEQITRDRQLLELMGQRVSLENESIERNRRRLKKRIHSTNTLAEAEREKNESYFAKQDENLKGLDEVTQRLGKDVADRFETMKRLREEGQAAADEIRTARRDYLESQVRIADVELRKHAMGLARLEAKADYRKRMDLVADLEFQLQQLDIQASKLKHLQREAESDSKLRIQEIEQNVARYEKQLDTKGLILSEYPGRILEVTAAVGQIVSAGERLGAIEAEQKGGGLIAVIYYDVADGKKIKREMPTQVALGTVQRERYGSIVGSVTRVSPYAVSTAAATNIVGNSEVARRLTEGGNKIQVRSELMLDEQSPSGFKWTSGKGPKVDITAGTPVTVRTTIEDRRPISYVIPLLRRWSGH